MILIITHKQDFTADYLIDKLNKKEIKYLRLNCEDLLYQPSFAIESVSDFDIQFDDYQKINSVWFRRTQIPHIENLTAQERLYFNAEFDSLLENIYSSLSDKRWLSNPFKVYQAENKILQLKLAKRLGFSTPKTLVTNSKKHILDFYNSTSKIIVKPLNSGYVINQMDEVSLFFTSIVNEHHIASLNDSELTPCIFQEYIEKEYEIRVTIVDDKIFSAKVNSQQHEETEVDWRRSKLNFEPYNLPKKIEKKCFDICHALNLSFGAFDIIKNKNNKDYTFLEINPNGQWAWIEMETGLEISSAIIDYLER